MSPQWSLSFRFPHQDHIRPLSSPIRATCPAHLILLDFLLLLYEYKLCISALYIKLFVSERKRIKIVNFVHNWQISAKFWMYLPCIEKKILNKKISVIVKMFECIQTKRTSGNPNKRVLHASRKNADKDVSSFQIKGYNSHFPYFVVKFSTIK